MRHLIGRAQNGASVYIDLVTANAAKHIAREPRLLALAAEALPHILLERPTVRLEYDMGRIVGYDFVVETEATDNIFYGQLIRDNTYTRFTKNSKPSASQDLSLILERNADHTSYDVQDIRIGKLTPPNPGSTEETSESRPYWKKHALIFEDQPLQTRTLTKTCPY